MERATLGTGAPKGTGTNHDYFHLTPSPLGLIFSFQNQDLIISGPCSSDLVALTASGTTPKLLVFQPLWGWRRELSGVFSSALLVAAERLPSPKCWVRFPTSEPLCPPASLGWCRIQMRRGRSFKSWERVLMAQLLRPTALESREVQPEPQGG